MNERKRVILLIFIMATTAFIVVGITISMLYRVAFKEQQARLMETAQSQTHLIEAVAQFDAVYSKDYPGGAAAVTIGQIINAYTKHEHIHSCRTAEFAVGRLDGDQINFLFRNKQDADVEHLKSISFDSKAAEPMRLAVSGHSGTVVGLDYRGEVVLATFEPVEKLNLGIVAKIDLAEIRAPFVKAGLIAGLITLLFVMVGASLFIRITKPMVKHLEERAAELKKNNTEIKREISERKQAEKTLIESEEKYRQLFENESDAVMIFDAETHRFEDANRAALDLYGYSKKEFLSLNAEDISTEKSKTKIALQKIKDNVPGSKLVPSRLHKKKDGTIFPVEIVIGIFNSNGRKKIIGAVRDISERKRLETRLQQANKLEAIGTLAGGIAHDFNNILTAVIGYTELALNNAEKETLLHANLQQVMTAGKRAKNLVRQILTFSRQNEQDLKSVQVKFIAKETLKLLRASLPATVDIRQNIQSDSIMMADPTQIHQVLMNLYTNAGHAMQENGGTLEVSLTDVELDSDFAVKCPGLKPGLYMKLTVSDTGHGIPPDVRDRIFDPFFTTKKEGEGTGMGLSVAHGIVKSHGGTITVYSEPEKGSIFNVFLPAIERAIEPETRIEKPVPSGTERILFIDDEQTLADLGKQMLESLGYDVAVRTSSIEALELFKNKPDGFDLVITDLTMPQMTGDELAQKLMVIRPDIPVILCTGFSARMDEKKARALGIRELAYKPLLLRDMAENIRKVLDGNNTLGDSSIKEPLQLGCRLKEPRYAGHGI